MFIFHLYGFFIGLGILVGAWFAEKIRKSLNTKYQILNTSVYDLVVWVVVWAIIGARLYHVINYWNYYSKNPIEIIYLWQGGLGIFGGILGGVIGIFIFLLESPRSNLCVFNSLREKTNNKNNDLGRSQAKTYKLCESPQASIRNIFERLLFFLDLAAFGLPVGQAIGRLGNYFNQELYGLPTNLPWGIYIKPENRLAGFENFQYFQPLFAYEAIWDLFIFIILLIFLNTKYQSGIAGLNTKQPGFFFFTYLFLYAFGRFWLEFLRINPWQIDGINVAQGISVGLILFCLIWLIGQICYHRKYE